MTKNQIVVAKFGGSSVKDAASMIQCAQIVQDHPEYKIIILSATYNTTNDLERIFKSYLTLP